MFEITIEYQDLVPHDNRVYYGRINLNRVPVRGEEVLIPGTLLFVKQVRTKLTISGNESYFVTLGF